MRTANVALALRGCIENRRPVLLGGAPGIGKSDLVKQAAFSLQSDIIVSQPVVSDPTDAKGLPWPDAEKKIANFLPFGQLARALNAKKSTVWFIDDLGQATQAVQGSFMQLVLERAIGEHQIPDCVTFVAATNGHTHRAGVQGLIEPLKSRFISIINVEAFFDDWKIWALETEKIRAEVIAFLTTRGKTNPDDQLFNKFDPTKELKNSPSPRTWEHVSQLLDINFPEEVRDEMFIGAVGEAAAREFSGYLKLYADLPNPDQVIVDPDQSRIPERPSSLYAISTALAVRATKTNFSRIVRYAERINAAGHGDIASLLARDCVRKQPEIANTRAYMKFLETDLGKVMAA